MKKFEIALVFALIVTLLFPEIYLFPAKSSTETEVQPTDIVVSEEITFGFKFVEIFGSLFSFS